MSTRQWYRKKRVARFDRIVEIRDILGNLKGVHEPDGQPKSTVTRFALILGLMAAVYIPVIIQDLSEGYSIKTETCFTDCSFLVAKNAHFHHNYRRCLSGRQPFLASSSVQQS